MAFVYAIKNNMMAIRASSSEVAFEEGRFMTELNIKLRGYTNKLWVRFESYIPPVQGYYITETTCVGSFMEVNNTKTCEMMVIAIDLDGNPSASENVLTMDSLVALAKTYRSDLAAVELSAFDSYIFNDKRYVTVYPDHGIFGVPRVNKVDAQPFLTTVNPLTQTIPSQDNLNPLSSQPQTIFPAFRM